MNVMILDRDYVPGMLQRLTGRTVEEDLQRDLAKLDRQNAANIRTLTSPADSLYGKTWWMVALGEAVMQNEARAEEIRATLAKAGKVVA